MEIGVFAFHLVDREGMPLDDFLEAAAALGIRVVELGTGGFVRMRDCPARDLLESAARRAALLEKLAAYGMRISALNAIGNPFHPDPGIAARCAAELQQTIELASQLQVDRVVAGGGCPGDFSGGGYPNWPVYPYFLDDLWERQWSTQIIPFWRETASRAATRGVRLCLEPHPVMAVYNCATFRRLRDEAGPAIGVNFDPSHLFWTGMDPLAVAQSLGPFIYHVHAKDTRVNQAVLRLNGFLDPTPFEQHERRSWNYCAVGDGHDAPYWRDLLGALSAAGYDGPLSIEHEDVTIHGKAALERNVRFLQVLLGPEEVGRDRGSE